MTDKEPGKSRNANLKGGSRKGVPNKVTAELKDMVLQALDGAGGVEYLVQRAKDPRTASAFLSLVGKTLPLTVKGDPAAPIGVAVTPETLAMLAQMNADQLRALASKPMPDR